MFKELRIKAEIHKKMGYSQSDTHVLGYEHREYYLELAEKANIDNLPDVYADIFTETLRSLIDEPMDFRKYKYSIHECNQTFTKEKEQ